MHTSRLLSGMRVITRPVINMSTTAVAAPGYNYETLAVTRPRDYVYQVELNRPNKLNTMNTVFWKEMGEVFQQLDGDSECRAVVLTGAGRVFTAGIDLSDMAELVGMVTGEEDVARKSRNLRSVIAAYQASFTALEQCVKPVIAGIHSACVGGGVDLICSADIRYCSADAWFQVKEIDVGLAADVGTLQRLPKIVGNESLVRELVFSARKMFSSEALQCGLVSRVFPDKESMMAGAVDMATLIASKSPVAVQTSKMALVHARDHSVQEGLAFVATLNMTMLQSEDLQIAAMALLNKEKPKFAKL